MPEPLSHRVAVYFGVAEPTEEERGAAATLPSTRRLVVGVPVPVTAGAAIALLLFDWSAADAVVFSVVVSSLSLTFRVIVARGARRAVR